MDNSDISMPAETIIKEMSKRKQKWLGRFHFRKMAVLTESVNSEQ
jgi:hypothetical protein